MRAELKNIVKYETLKSKNNMATKSQITVKDVNIRTMTVNGMDYICITDIARQKNETEPKDVVKNWMRQKNTLEYLGLWERLHNPNFKGVEFDPLLAEAGSNAFTMSPTKWVELTAAIGIITKNGVGGGTINGSETVMNDVIIPATTNVVENESKY